MRPFGSQPETEGRPMALGFTYKLELTDGTPADPPSSAPLLNWRPGDAIPPGERWLRVVAVRDDEADQPSVLIVEDVELEA
jgi:hypothetical protein